MSTIIKVGKKGIVVIPKKYRELLGLKENSLIQMEIRNNELVIKPFSPKRVKLKGRVQEIVLKLKREELELEG